MSGGGGTPSPTPVPAEGVAQLFMDEGCTTLAEGDFSGELTLYMRFNDAVEGEIALISKDGPGNVTINVSEDSIYLMGSTVYSGAVLPISAGTIIPLKVGFDSPTTWSVNMSIYILGE